MSTLRDRLAEARLDLGLSQSDLAKRTGLRQPTITELESGASQGSKYIVEIALALNVSPMWLALGQGPKELDPIKGAMLKLDQDEQKTVLAFIEGVLSRRNTTPPAPPPAKRRGEK